MENSASHQGAWNHLLAQEQLRLLNQGLPASIAANVFLASVLVWAQSSVIELKVLLVWIFLLFTVLLIRGAFYIAYRSQQPIASHRIVFWLWQYRLAIFATGSLWGATGVLFFPSDNIPHQFFIAFVLAGLTAGAITSLAMDKVSAFLLVVPALLPLITNFFIEKTSIGHAMAAMVMFFMLYVLISSARLQKDLHESVRLRSTLGHTFELLERSNAAALIGTWEVDLVSNQAHWSAITKQIHEVPTDFCCEVEKGIQFYKEGEHRHKITQAFSLAVTKGESFDEELVIVTTKGNERWVRVIGTPELSEGVCRNIYGTFQDVTERKRTERIKSEFISTVSHELRTPLTAISASLAVMKGGALGEFSAPVTKLLDIAHKNSLRLTHLINDLLDMDKLVAGKMYFDMQVQEVLPLIEHALANNQSYAEQYKVTLVLQANDAHPRIRVDASRLQQVLVNLLSNAIKFSPAGSVVILIVSEYEQRVRIAVMDQGSGIPAEFHARIFQKFSQADSSDSRQKGGTGLGLAITRELVERMGGTIGFESQENQGTTFFIEFERA